MKAERIDSGLHPKVWSFNRTPDSVARQVALLTDGSGEAEVDGERFVLAAPAVLWLGNGRPGRLRVEAGATGYRGWVSDAMALAAIGDQPDSVSLRSLVERSFVLSLSGRDAQATVLERCFRGVVAELRQPQEASPLLLSGLLRIMLVSVIRVSAGDEADAPGSGEKGSLLQRFRQLVEMNFRSHWTIAQYAGALGISTDRLHAICTSGISKSPKALVSERLAHEAALRLERSPLTIQQLGHSLGFNDPAHFSTFFRRMTGSPPGRYRKAAALSRLEGRNPPATSFADWP